MHREGGVILSYQSEEQVFCTSCSSSSSFCFQHLIVPKKRAPTPSPLFEGAPGRLSERRSMSRLQTLSFSLSCAYTSRNAFDTMTRGYQECGDPTTILMGHSRRPRIRFVRQKDSMA